MKHLSNAFAAFSVIAAAFARNNAEPASITAIPTTVARDQLNARAIDPTAPGQIGINPPDTNAIKGSIGVNTEYLTEENGSYTWKGTGTYITVVTTTSTDKAGSTSEVTMTKGVITHKNKNGGLDFLLTPGVRTKLQAIAKQVTPCGSQKRSTRPRKRGATACGLRDFVERVGQDPELRETFTEQITDQVWSEVDSGYGSDPENDPGWEGDGGPEHGDEGYFSDNEDGWFNGEEGSEAGDTLETIVFSSEEEAAAIAAAAGAGSEGAMFGGSTITAGSFLAMIWKAIEGATGDNKTIDPVFQIPSESIQKITKTKTPSSTSTSTSTSSDSCPKPTAAKDIPACGKGCEPTKIKTNGTKETNQAGWACSKGKSKDCLCNPPAMEVVHPYEADIQQAFWEAIKDLKDSPVKPVTSCEPPLSNVPSDFFGDITKNFCPEAMKLKNGYGPTAYDAHGNKIQLLARSDTLVARSPPVKQDDYKDYRFFLEWKPSDGDCRLPKDNLCEDAFKQLINSVCGHNSGNPINSLYVDAKIDVGCGEFSWHVEKPKPKPNPVKELQCHEKHDHYTVHDATNDAWVKVGCDGFYKDTKMKAGDKESYWSIPGAAIEWYQNWRVSWVDGCDEYKEQSVAHPIEGDDSHTCYTIMRDNYKTCDKQGNNASGGSRQVGCLKYDFWVQ